MFVVLGRIEDKDGEGLEEEDVVIRIGELVAVVGCSPNLARPQERRVQPPARTAVCGVSLPVCWVASSLVVPLSV
jgi:hypothetical protein